MGTVREGSGAGRYEVRDYQGGGLKVIVWVEPGKPPLIMTTIAADRLPLLAQALNEHLKHPFDGRPPSGAA